MVYGCLWKIDSSFHKPTFTGARLAMISPSKLWMWDRFEILDGNFRLNPLKSKIDLGLSLSNYQS